MKTTIQHIVTAIARGLDQQNAAEEIPTDFAESTWLSEDEYRVLISDNNPGETTDEFIITVKRRIINTSHKRAASRITCECGVWDGHFACQWSGPIEETTIVEFMPHQHRASHAEARNSGNYPQNGARRIRVNLECAKRMQKYDRDWVEILGNP